MSSLLKSESRYESEFTRRLVIYSTSSFIYPSFYFIASTIFIGMQGFILQLKFISLHLIDRACFLTSLVRVLIILVILFSNFILGVSFTFVFICRSYILFLSLVIFDRFETSSSFCKNIASSFFYKRFAIERLIFSIKMSSQLQNYVYFSNYQFAFLIPTSTERAVLEIL